MADMCGNLEHLARGEAARETADAVSILAQLKDLLRQTTQHVMLHTACLAGD
jgi:hypothetical protein